MIYTELNEYTMQEQLAACERDNFSLEALRTYISFVEELGENTEFDPIDFDCSYVEFDLGDKEERKSFINDYDYLVEGDEFEEENDKVEAIQTAIKENTLVICGTYNNFMFDYNF